jgi:DNA-binding CsgD family transcriptional regulator
MLTEDQTGARMQIYRALGWTRAVAGDVEGALKHVLRSATLAQTPAQRVYAGLDHASIALFAGERSGSARAAYSLALETADAITWSDIRSDDLAALPLLVLVAALLGDEKSARRYCSMARKCVGQISGRFALKHDKRFMAMLDEAEALTLRGSHNEILRLGKSSYAVFSRIGYVWRAARMAAYLFQRTHDARWEKKATAHLRGIVAGSPLHGVLAEAKRICGLPARPKQVLELVCERRTDDQIAELLGMKPNTVRVHLNRIYRYFGVRGRLALYARLAS